MVIAVEKAFDFVVRNEKLIFPDVMNSIIYNKHETKHEHPKRTRNERNRSSSPRPQEPIFDTFILYLNFEVRIRNSHLEQNRM